MSESTRPLPTFCFSSYSRRLITSPIRLKITISITKIPKMAWSSGPHFCNLRIEGDFLLPLRKVTVMESKMVMSAIKCLSHCLKCEFSASNNFSKELISSCVATEIALNFYFVFTCTASVEKSKAINYFTLPDLVFFKSSSNEDLPTG
jgi:hypothetical protein